MYVPIIAMLIVAVVVWGLCLRKGRRLPPARSRNHRPVRRLTIDVG